jgi:hypothetical protein
MSWVIYLVIPPSTPQFNSQQPVHGSGRHDYKRAGLLGVGWGEEGAAIFFTSFTLHQDELTKSIS